MGNCLKRESSTVVHPELFEPKIERKLSDCRDRSCQRDALEEEYVGLLAHVGEALVTPVDTPPAAKVEDISTEHIPEMETEKVSEASLMLPDGWREEDFIVSEDLPLICEALKKGKIDFNARTGNLDKNSWWMEIVKSEKIDLLKYLIDVNPIDFSAVNKLRQSVLHVAAKSRSAQVPQTLSILISRASPQEVNRKDLFKQTPLHLVSGADGKEPVGGGLAPSAVKMLMEGKADPFAPDRYGYLPLHYAVLSDALEVCKEILLPLTLSQADRLLSATDDQGRGVLDMVQGEDVGEFLAISCGARLQKKRHKAHNLQEVLEVIEAPNTRYYLLYEILEAGGLCGVYLGPAVFRAAEVGRGDDVDRFLDILLSRMEAKPDDTSAFKLLQLILKRAEISGQMIGKVVNVLDRVPGLMMPLRTQYMATANGMSLLHFISGDPENPPLLSRAAVLPFFLSELAFSNIDLLRPDDRGRVPAHYAAGCGDCELLEMICSMCVESGTVLDWQGMSPLYVAAAYGRFATVKFLSEKYSFDFSAPSSMDFGVLPLHLAAASPGGSEAVDYLLRKAGLPGSNPAAFIFYWVRQATFLKLSSPTVVLPSTSRSKKGSKKPSKSFYDMPTKLGARQR